MYKALFYFLLGIFLFSKSYGQQTPSDKHIMDSLIQNDEFLKMIDQIDDNDSYFRINMGIGNRLLNGDNKALQNLEPNNSLVFTPSAGYFHKSGLSLSITGFLLSQNRKTNFYQYAVTPSFSYNKGKVADGIISYNHYFKSKSFNSSVSPFDDEIYGGVLFKKTWIKPGLSTGYSAGNYNEIVSVDTSVLLQNRLTHIKFVDTANTKISSFSVSGSIEHDFYLYTLLSTNDAIRFTPQLLVISGINGYSVSHKRSAQVYKLYSEKKLKKLRRFRSSTDKGKYEIQSVGLDLDVDYSIGKFYFEPEVYLDYYLPKTSVKTFTQVFNFNIGITF
ncbi:MAG: hypothetical protein M3Z56_01265 [Bacteroidota bacterium]|nr:hypothetical protein [Bacteroidota bacterium]